MNEEKLGVPTIDIGALDAPETRAQLDAACREWGFFQVVGHGVAANLAGAVHEQMRALFALPEAEKRAIERTATNAWGYYDRELTKNVRDWKQVYDVGPEVTTGPLAGQVPQWPATLPDFAVTVATHYAACERLALRLLDVIACNLGVPPRLLRESFRKPHTSFLRLNYYPRCDEPAAADAPTMPAVGELGVHHHTDAGALTILLQDEQPGLQVHRDGHWYTVEPRADAFVVNIGDIVQVWSNDLYRAALHRVIVSRDVERYSAPFFLNPACDAVYAPLASRCSRRRPPRYRPIRWGEFRAARAAGDYADLGEEIQIAHYRVPTL